MLPGGLAVALVFGSGSLLLCRPAHPGTGEDRKEPQDPASRQCEPGPRGSAER